MNTKKLNEKISAANEYASIFQTCEKFAGHTEAEVAKGLAFSFAVLCEIRNEKDAGRSGQLSNKQIEQILSAIGIDSDNGQGVSEVTQMFLNMLESKVSQNASV